MYPCEDPDVTAVPENEAGEKCDPNIGEDMVRRLGRWMDAKGRRYLTEEDLTVVISRSDKLPPEMSAREAMDMIEDVLPPGSFMVKRYILDGDRLPEPNDKDASEIHEELAFPHLPSIALACASVLFGAGVLSVALCQVR